MLIFTSFPPLSFFTFLYLFLPLPSLYPLYLCLPIFTSSFPISLYFFLYLCIPVYLCLLMLASFRPLSFFTFLYLFLPHSTPSNSFYLFSTSLSTSLYLLYLCLPLCTSFLSTSFYFFLSLCTLVHPSLPVFASLPTSISLPFSLSLSTYFYLSTPIFTCVYHSVPLLFCLSSLLSIPLYPCLSTSLYLFTSTFLYLFLPLSTYLVTSTLSTCIYFSSPLFAAIFVLFLSLLPFSGSLHLHFSCAFPFYFLTPLPLSVCSIFFAFFSTFNNSRFSKSLHTNTLPFVATTSRLSKTRRKIETSNRN